MTVKKIIQEKVIPPVFIGTVTITVCVFLLRLLAAHLPVIKLAELISEQTSTSVGFAFLLLCLVSILYTYFYIAIFNKKVQINSWFFKGGSFGFISSMLTMYFLLVISVLTQSIVSYEQLKPLLLSVIVTHIIGGILIAGLVSVTSVTTKHFSKNIVPKKHPYHHPFLPDL